MDYIDGYFLYELAAYWLLSFFSKILEIKLRLDTGL